MAAMGWVHRHKRHGALFALVNAVMYGSVTVAVRGMTRTESANTLVIWQLSVLAFFHSFLLFFGWVWPTPLVEDISVTSAICPSLRSSGLATLVATVSGLAPGSEA